jgi:predicted CopG family antitoxin
MKTNTITISGERYEAIVKIAETKGTSLSIVVEELLNKAIEQEEDSRLLNIVKKRKKENESCATISHEEAWR